MDNEQQKLERKPTTIPPCIGHKTDIYRTDKGCNVPLFSQRIRNGSRQQIGLLINRKVSQRRAADADKTTQSSIKMEDIDQSPISFVCTEIDVCR